jgi:hypothetical protein
MPKYLSDFRRHQASRSNRRKPKERRRSKDHAQLIARTVGAAGIKADRSVVAIDAEAPRARAETTCLLSLPRSVFLQPYPAS